MFSVNISPRFPVSGVAETRDSHAKFASQVSHKSIGMTFAGSQESNSLWCQLARPLSVHHVGHWLHMSRIDTRFVATEMVKLETIRNAGDALLVDESVCVQTAIATIDTPVPVFVAAMKPDPTKSLISAISNRVVVLSNEFSAMDVARRIQRGISTAASTKFHIVSQRVTSLGGVAHRGWRKPLPLAPFYLAVNLEGGKPWR